MTTSLVYRSAVGYELLMRALYRRHYGDRMRAVAAEVPDGASVLELCCGPGTLYARYLKDRVGSYIGLDLNERFVAGLRRSGVDARVADLARSGNPLPEADVVIMQASLYHFLAGGPGRGEQATGAERIVDRMLDAARETVIISEPVRNLASSGNPLIALVGRRGADPGVGGAQERFDARTLDQLFERYRDRVLKAELIPGGREKLYVLSGRREA